MTSNSSRAVQLAVYCRKDTMRGGTTNFYANGTLRNEQIVLHPNDLNAYATVLRVQGGSKPATNAFDYDLMAW